MVFQNSDWNGLRINDPFDTPECVVEVYIDGVSKLGNSVSTYPLGKWDNAYFIAIGFVDVVLACYGFMDKHLATNLLKYVAYDGA